MQYKIGKITDYDGIAGRIVTIDEIYEFLKQDLKEEVKNGDLVMFRNETINNIKKAFFIKKVF